MKRWGRKEALRYEYFSRYHGRADIVEAYQTKILSDVLEELEAGSRVRKEAVPTSISKETNTSDVTLSSTQLDIEARDIEMDIAETLKKMNEKKSKPETLQTPSVSQNKVLEEKFPLKMIDDDNLGNLEFDFPIRSLGRGMPPKGFFPEDLTHFSFQPITKDLKINCRPIFLEDSGLSKNLPLKKSKKMNFSEDPQTISSSSNSNSWIEGNSELDYMERLPCFNFTNIIDAGTFQVSINDLGQQGKLCSIDITCAIPIGSHQFVIGTQSSLISRVDANFKQIEKIADFKPEDGILR